MDQEKLISVKEGKDIWKVPSDGTLSNLEAS
jgi:hypothetical protein